MIIKKILAILAAACISMAVFTGCGDSDDKKDDEKNKTSSSDKLSADDDAADENDDTDDNGDDDNNDDNDDYGDSELVGKWETVELSDSTSNMVMKGDATVEGMPLAMMMQIELYDDGTCDFCFKDITGSNNLEFSGSWESSGNTVTITNPNNDKPAELTLKNGQLIIDTGEMKITLGKVIKFTKKTGNGDSDDGDDSFDGSVIGKWEVKSMSMSDGSGYFGGENIINGVSVKLFLQIELYSDGTCDISSMGGTEQASGTWELNGDTVTMDADGDKMDFTLSNGLLKGSFTSSKGSAAIALKKVNKFSK